MIKTYKMKMLYGKKVVFPIDMPTGSKTITFEKQNRDDAAYFFSENENEQKGIEASSLFKEKTITIFSSVGSEDVKKEDVKLTVFEDVKTLQDAKDILRAEPYSIPFQSISTPERIMAKATEYGVSFPNLVI